MTDSKYTTQELQWFSEARAKSWSWLGQIDRNYSLYRHFCGHEQAKTMVNMRTNICKCDHCWLEKIKSEADSKGCLWIRHIDRNRCLYRLRCGHEQIMHMAHVRTGQVNCKQCKSIKYKSETPDNWEWLHQIDKSSSLYKHTCGHNQVSQMSNMRNDLVACHNCGETHHKRPSNLYILFISLQGEHVIKVGVSNNMSRRLFEYGLPSDCEVSIVRIKPFATGDLAREIENKIKRKFKAKKLKSVKHIFQVSGHTECFSTSVLDEILKVVA